MAATQKFCPVLEGSRLGSMGKPIKLMLNGQPVFVCCAACPKEAAKDPDKTLRKVAELKDKNARKDR